VGPAGPYMIALALAGRQAVVVGGGAVAERKVRGLLGAGADVTVVAPDATPAIRDLAASGRLALTARAFCEADLDGAMLAFAATDESRVNADVVSAARARGILVDDTSDAARGDFSTPAVHRSGPLTISVDSAGSSPSFARRVRDEIAVRFDERYARATETLRRMRAYARDAVDEARRPAVLRRLAERNLDELASMNPSAAEDAVDAVLQPCGGTFDRSGPLGPELICASRGSALALKQARHVMARLAEHGIPSTIATISTRGDELRDRSLASLGGDGVFVKELERALRERRADYAVHSCKDLPSELPADMRIAAIGTREDPRDAFCSERFASFEDLPPGAIVGTSSPRRRALLLSARPDLRFEELRGNVDTRLRKLRDGHYDAIVLAMAGLVRLGLRATHTRPFDAHVVVPAVGQGALAIECRADDESLASRLGVAFNDRASSLAIAAERGFLRKLRAGCAVPVGALATHSDETLAIFGAIASADGSCVIRDGRTATIADAAAAEALGEALAGELLDAGGDGLLSRRHAPHPLAGKLFLLPRTQERPSRIAPALRSAGADVVEARDSAQAIEGLGGRIPDVLLFPSSGSVDAVREYLGTLRDGGRRPIVAAMGESSSLAASRHGFPPDVMAPEPQVASFVHGVTQYVLEKA
jgi:hydroxymethylbilane synthase